MGVRSLRWMVAIGIVMVMIGCQRDALRDDRPETPGRPVRISPATSDPQPDSTTKTARDPQADVARHVPDPAQLRKAYSFLVTTTLVESHLVGFAAAESEGFRAFTMIMRSGDARTMMESLLVEAQPAGKAYALCGLYHLDRKGSRDLIVSYEEDDTPVQVLVGCIGGKKTLGTFVRHDMHAFNSQLTGVLEVSE